jgi:hypothetical protein
MDMFMRARFLYHHTLLWLQDLLHCGFLHVACCYRKVVLHYSICIFWLGTLFDQVAVDSNDPQMCDFIEGEFLTEQVSDCCIMLLSEGKDRLGLLAQESSSYCTLWIARVNK